MNIDQKCDFSLFIYELAEHEYKTTKQADIHQRRSINVLCIYSVAHQSIAPELCLL